MIIVMAASHGDHFIALNIPENFTLTKAKQSKFK